MERFSYMIPDISALNKKGYLCVDMHLHTIYSDGLADIPYLIRLSKKRQMGFAVTDHMTIKGAIESVSKSRRIIPGIEVGSSDGKDVLFYFYDAKELKRFFSDKIDNHRHKRYKNRTTYDFFSLLGLGKGYNCITSVAHPSGLLWKDSLSLMKRKEHVEDIAVEAINSGLSDKKNQKAVDYIKKYRLPFTAGSDSHTKETLGSAITFSKANSIKEFLDDIRKRENFVAGTIPTGYTLAYLRSKIIRKIVRPLKREF